MTTNPLLAFLQEFFQRLSTKSPKFFRVIQLITAITTIITGLPEFLKMFNIALPQALSALENKTIAIATMTAFLISKLTTQSTPVAQTESGQVLKTTNEEKLPFTAASELKMGENKPALPTVMQEVEQKTIEKKQ